MKEEPKTYYYKNLFGTFLIAGLMSYIVSLYSGHVWVAALVGALFCTLVALVVTNRETAKHLSCLKDKNSSPEVEKGITVGLFGLSGVLIFLLPQIKFDGILKIVFVYLFGGVSFLALVLSVFIEADRPGKKEEEKRYRLRGGMDGK